MNIPPAGSYDSVLFFWFEKYHEDYMHQVIVTNRLTENAARGYVQHGFSKDTQISLDYCAVTFWKDGTQLELWELMESRRHYV